MRKLFKLFELLLISPDTNQGYMVKSLEKSREEKEDKRSPARIWEGSTNIEIKRGHGSREKNCKSITVKLRVLTRLV